MNTQKKLSEKEFTKLLENLVNEIVEFSTNRIMNLNINFLEEVYLDYVAAAVIHGASKKSIEKVLGKDYLEQIKEYFSN